MTGGDERTTRRRGVLGGLAVGAAAVAGLSNPVAADTGRGRQPGLLAQVEVRQRFGDAASFERAFADHDDMLAELAGRGMLDAASAADFETGRTRRATARSSRCARSRRPTAPSSRSSGSPANSTTAGF